MRVVLSTNKLQNMMSKAVKGSSNNKLLPLTSLMAIEVVNKQLTITTFDGNNYLYITDNSDDYAEDFYVCIPTEIFAKLVAKTTSANITLDYDSNSLKVIGNGTYNVEFPTDENGNFIKFPKPLQLMNFDEKPTIITLDTINALLKAKVAVATSLEFPCLTGYYVGDEIVATNQYEVYHIGNKVFDTPYLLRAETVNLLDIIKEDNIEVYTNDNKMCFKSTQGMLYCTELDGIEDYPISAIKEFVNSEFDASCSFSKVEMLQLLDRLSLFVGVLDDNAIDLEFTEDCIKVSSKRMSGTESIKYVNNSNVKPFKCSIDIICLQEHIKSCILDDIMLHYGIQNAIKLADSDTTHILSLLEN